MTGSVEGNLREILGALTELKSGRRLSSERIKAEYDTVAAAEESMRVSVSDDEEENRAAREEGPEIAKRRSIIEIPFIFASGWFRGFAWVFYSIEYISVG